ncbi:MAG: T9SS C-terminal target domain-containing protein [Ignavibacteriae bacterium]|nr:MAG: T9SS C-terminal target domain-containing protein [Ignavibacteriota bacterium]
MPRREHVDVLQRAGLRVLYAVLPYEKSLTHRRTVKPEDQLLELERRSTLDTARIIVLESELLRSYVVSYDGDAPPAKMASLLRTGCSEIEICEAVVIDELFSVPNDPRVNEQTMLATIRAFDGWDVHAGSDTVLIGISDSGVRQDHEDLKDAIAVNNGEIPDNNIDDDNNGYVDDYRGYNFCTKDDGTPPGNTYNAVEGHGTAVAGITGASVNNGIGIAGVANACKIVPLKTMPDNIRGIVYGYESIMYCALNGIHVVNCSWGSTSKSCINESVVAYAVARGVAVVAAAGNHGTSTPFYPGSYQGVLNVGVTDAQDNVIAMSGHGPTVDVMAPGQNTVATSNDGTYGGFCCTSGSSPIVAGVVGLVRSLRPELTGLQACAVVRELVVEKPWASVPATIDARLLPRGRVDVLSALDTSATAKALPSFEVLPGTITTTSPDTRWTVGDTISVRVPVVNVLASSQLRSLTFNEVVSTFSPALRVISPVTQPIDLLAETNDTLTLPEILCVVERETDTTEFLSTTLVADPSQGPDRAVTIMLPITPAPAFRILQNDLVTMSVGDRGRIGNTDLDRGQGTGFSYRQWCGQLYEGGLMVSTGNKIVDAVRDVRKTNDHFAPSKRFTRPDPLRSVVTDADAPDSMRIGVEIEQQVWLGAADSTVFYTDITITNISDEILDGVAVAWFCDWDLGNQPVNNRTFLASESWSSVTQCISSTTAQEPVVLMRASTTYADGGPISAGIDNATTYGGFSPSRKITIMNSGTSTQFDDPADVASIVGWRFTSQIPPRHKRSFRVSITIDTSYEGAMDQEQYIYAVGSPHPQPIDSIFTTPLGPLYPNPASSIVMVPVNGVVYDGYEPAMLRVFDAQGREVLQQSYESHSSSVVIPLDVRTLPNGMYFVRFDDAYTMLDPDAMRHAKLMIVR